METPQMTLLFERGFNRGIHVGEMIFCGTLLFHASKWCGVLPFNASGKLSAVWFSFSIGLAIVGFAVSAVTRFHISLRFATLSDTQVFVGSALLPLCLNLVMVATCVVHLMQCYRSKHDFEHLLNFSRTRKKFTMGEALTCFGIVLHVGMLFFPCVELLDFGQNVSISLPGFWNYIIALQFREFLDISRYKLKILTTLIRQRKTAISKVDRLVDTAILINKLYQRQHVFIIAQVFGYGVVYSFYAIKFLIITSVFIQVHLELMCFYSAMLLSRIVMLISVADCCQRFKLQVGAEAIDQAFELKNLFSFRHK